jgi:ABC-type nitrate/sulfonate/bicarbonate transport system substrate-binding protein
MTERGLKHCILVTGSILIVGILIIIAGCTQSTNGTTGTAASGATGTTASGSSSGSTAAPAAQYTIRANVDKDCTATPWLVGEQLGFFKANNINFVDSGSLDWSLMPASLVAGKTDVYDAEINTLINLRQGGADVVGVVRSNAEPAPTDSVHSNHMHWLVLNTSEYTPETIKSLAASGHKPKVAVGALGICADLETQAWFRQYNLTKDDFEFIVMPDPDQEAALRQGQIDIAVLHPPFYTAAQQHGGVRILATSYDAFGSEGGYSVLVFTKEYIQKNPEAVRAFIKAFKDSERWSNDHPVESGNLLKNNIGLSGAASHYYSYSGAISDSDIQPWIDEMIADGDLKAGEVKASDLYTTQFSDLWVNETTSSPLVPNPTT